MGIQGMNNNLPFFSFKRATASAGPSGLTFGHRSQEKKEYEDCLALDSFPFLEPTRERNG